MTRNAPCSADCAGELCAPAFAYLDPSTGSMILSAIVGLFATLALTIKTYWYKLKAFFRRDAQPRKSPGEDKDSAGGGEPTRTTEAPQRRLGHRQGSEDSDWRAVLPELALIPGLQATAARTAPHRAVFRERSGLASRPADCRAADRARSARRSVMSLPRRAIRVCTRIIRVSCRSSSATVSFAFSGFRPCEADLLLTQLLDLDNFDLKRSVHPVHYVYMFHSLISTHMADHANSYDHYDTILCAGPHQAREIRRREELEGLPAKQPRTARLPSSRAADGRAA